MQLFLTFQKQNLVDLSRSHATFALYELVFLLLLFLFKKILKKTIHILFRDLVDWGGRGPASLPVVIWHGVNDNAKGIHFIVRSIVFVCYLLTF